MKQELIDLDSVDINHLVQDRDAFNDFVYTPVEEALKEIKIRWNDTSIPEPAFVPESMKKTYRGVLFRQVVTSNYEVRRFVSIMDSLKIEVLFWEYLEDKFTSNNEWKHALGKLLFYRGRSSAGVPLIESKTIVDFARYDGDKLSEVKTLWGQPLVEFHHEFVEKRFRSISHTYFDASAWCRENGVRPTEYYRAYLALFVKHGILFDNFMLDTKEISFTRDVFLPAFIEAYRTTGYKPLVVSLEPTDIEGDRFWMCHPHEDMDFVKEKLAQQTVQAVLS